MKNVPLILPKDLADSILEVAKHFNLSKEDFLEQAIGLFLDWREFDACRPLSEEGKLEAIKKFAEKIFGEESCRRCI